jgi:hypothetical protein
MLDLSAARGPDGLIDVPALRDALKVYTGTVDQGEKIDAAQIRDCGGGQFALIVYNAPVQALLAGRVLKGLEIEIDNGAIMAIRMVDSPGDRKMLSQKAQQLLKAITRDIPRGPHGLARHVVVINKRAAMTPADQSPSPATVKPSAVRGLSSPGVPEGAVVNESLTAAEAQRRFADFYMMLPARTLSVG